MYAAAAAKSLQLCPTLCNPIDGSPPGSPLPGILQARTLEWVAIPFSQGFPDPGIKPRCPAVQVDSLLSEPPGNSDLILCTFFFNFILFLNFTILYWVCQISK